MFFLLFGVAYVHHVVYYAIERTFDIGSEGSLKLSNVNGWIQVSTHNSQTIYIEATKIARKPSDQKNLDIIFEHSVTYTLDDIADVFGKESEDLDTQGSLKTVIMP